MSNRGSSSNSNSCNHDQFRKGDEIEVRRKAGDGDAPVWFPATVIDSLSLAGPLYVEFNASCRERDGEERGWNIRDYVDVIDGVIRPVPPADPHRCFVIGDEVEVLHGMGWRRGEVQDVYEDSKYMVAIGALPIRVEKWRVRACLDWKQDDGSWVPSPLDQHQEKSHQLDLRYNRGTKLMIMYSTPVTPRTVLFDKGTMVEVERDKEGYRGSWHTAFIVESLQNNKFVVEYFRLMRRNETRALLLQEEAEPLCFISHPSWFERLQEEVDASCIRPLPPRIERHERFVELEQVDAQFKDGWWMGTVTDVLDQSDQYLVYFTTADIVKRFWHCQLRPHQEWFDKEWVPASDPKALELEKEYARKEPKFSEGTRVEVTSVEEGYYGCWYLATVVGSEGEGKLLVQYDKLTTDDGMQPLVEMVYASNLRPLPPIVNRHCRFKMLELVDARYNDGWWEGVISEVLDGMKYAVYFWTTNEELEFEHSDLRSHHELIERIFQKWVVASSLTPELAAKPRPKKVKIPTGGGTSMARGLKVEIAHGVVGRVSTWYPAVVLRPVPNGKYLVEYQTLKTDEGFKLLREEVDALCIRPGPPIIQRADQFQLNDRVDAWDVNRWRTGEICRTLKDSKYAVYFWANNTVGEFRHAYLRPRQDFIDGDWHVVSSCQGR